MHARPLCGREQGCRENGTSLCVPPITGIELDAAYSVISLGIWNVLILDTFLGLILSLGPTLRLTVHAAWAASDAWKVYRQNKHVVG